ncbi:uncharacterized protein [Typha angustifolia]|uniref:uncharacterized protein isoform X2 n=1 Tax=Typha angustifolia TaxID=59011 RepID=UPI003C30405C
MAAKFARALLTLRASMSSIPYSNSSFLVTRNPVSRSLEFLNIWPKSIEIFPVVHAPILKSMFSMQRLFVKSLYSSGVGRKQLLVPLLQLWFPQGKRFLTGSFLGISAAAGMTYCYSDSAYAMDDHLADLVEPLEYLKDELRTFWAFTRKFQLPAVFLIMVFFGWRHPLTLAINVALLLFCTRPYPFSIYIFIEQLRQRDTHRHPRLGKPKFLYARKVELHDYKLLCLAEVELRDKKLYLVGILGGWWIFSVLRIYQGNNTEDGNVHLGQKVGLPALEDLGREKS